jgi:hypothetical protein
MEMDPSIERKIAHEGIVESQHSRKRSRVQVSNPLAPVRTSPVQVGGSQVPHLAVEILNDHNIWETVDIHSPQYRLISNETVDMVTKDILAASDLSWRETGSTVWTGRFYGAQFISDGLVDVPEVGDSICLGLKTENSYNGACQFRISLQAYVLSCCNGLVSPRLFRSFAVRHTNGNDFKIDEAVSVLSTGMTILEQIAPRVSALSKIPLTIDLLAQVARETRLPDREWGHITRELNGIHDLWGLLQKITRRLTHEGRGRAGLLAQEVVGKQLSLSA